MVSKEGQCNEHPRDAERSLKDGRLARQHREKPLGAKIRRNREYCYSR
jgi:hypothetical protein